MRVPRRFSLRILLAAMTVLAMGLALWAGYRRATLCHTHWIDPASTSAVKFPAPQIKQREDGRYGFSYYSQRRLSHDYMRTVQPILMNRKKAEWKSNGQTFELAAKERETAEQCLLAIQQADVLAPGTFVIRGRVVDARGLPLAGAHITVRGPGDFYESRQARDDGTIMMPLSNNRRRAMPGSGYWFTVQPKVHADDFQFWQSRGFSLDPKHPEMVVVVTVPIVRRQEP